MNSQQHKDAGKILDKLEVCKFGLSRADIHKIFYNHRSSDSIDETIRYLESEGMIEHEKIHGTGGRAIQMYFPSWRSLDAQIQSTIERMVESRMEQFKSEFVKNKKTKPRKKFGFVRELETFIKENYKPGSEFTLGGIRAKYAQKNKNIDTENMPNFSVALTSLKSEGFVTMIKKGRYEVK